MALRLALSCGKLVLEGLHRRYRDRADGIVAQVDEELGIIADVGYEEYFLMVWDMLQECRRRGIEWITRGSAADAGVLLPGHAAFARSGSTSTSAAS